MTDIPDTAHSVLNQTEREARRRRRSVSRWLKRIIFGLLAAAMGMALVYAAMPRPLAVDVAAAVRGPLQVYVHEDGKTRVKHRYKVWAPLNGTMLRVALHPGDSVAEGEALFRILPTAAPLLDERTRARAQAQLAAAQADLRQAQANANIGVVLEESASSEAARFRAMGERGAVSQQSVEQTLFAHKAQREELARAQFAVKVAKHRVAEARAVLGRLQAEKGRSSPSKSAASAARGDDGQFHVTAPAAGVVLDVSRESEGYISAGTEVLEIGDPGALEIVADILTNDAVQIQAGDAVRITGWHSGEESHLNGRVRLIEPSAFTRISALGVEEQRVNVIVDFDDPHERWQVLGDGYRIEVNIEVWSADDVLSVPSSAVFRHGDDWAVFAICDAGIACLTPIELGRRNPDRAHVQSGLKEGQRVILNPSDRITSGIRVVDRAEL